jgi:hypothetical protein
MGDNKKITLEQLKKKQKVGDWIVTVGKKGDKKSNKNSKQVQIPYQAKLPVEKKKDKEQEDAGSQSTLFQ